MVELFGKTVMLALLLAVFLGVKLEILKAQIS